MFQLFYPKNQIDQLQTELAQLNEQIANKDDAIKEMRSNLLSDQKTRTFELGEIQKDNEARVSSLKYHKILK